MKFDLKSVILAMVTMLASGALSIAAPLKVMSFNIRGDFDLEAASNSLEAWNSLSDNHRRDLVATTIRDASPDVLGVQEAFRHQLVDLQSLLPGYEYYGVGRDDGEATGEHSAIFYRKDRFRRLGQGTFWLSNTPTAVGSKFPDAAYVRIASWVILADSENDGQEYFVLNTHWDHVSQAARLHSAKLIHSQLGELSAGRSIIVMGDMNAHEDNVAIATLRSLDDSDGRRLFDSYRELVPQRGKNEATFHNFEGHPEGSRIDYILHSGDLRVSDAGIIRTKFEDRYPSDHFPITTILFSVEKAAGGVVPTNPR